MDTHLQVYQVTFVSVKLQPKWLDIPQEIICTSSNSSFFLFLYICSLIQRLNSYGEYAGSLLLVVVVVVDVVISKNNGENS